MGKLSSAALSKIRGATGKEIASEGHGCRVTVGNTSAEQGGLFSNKSRLRAEHDKKGLKVC